MNTLIICFQEKSDLYSEDFEYDTLVPKFLQRLDELFRQQAESYRTFDLDAYLMMKIEETNPTQEKEKRQEELPDGTFLRSDEEGEGEESSPSEPLKLNKEEIQDQSEDEEAVQSNLEGIFIRRELSSEEQQEVENMKMEVQLELEALEKKSSRDLQLQSDIVKGMMLPDIELPPTAPFIHQVEEDSKMRIFTRPGIK